MLGLPLGSRKEYSRIGLFMSVVYSLLGGSFLSQVPGFGFSA